MKLLEEEKDDKLSQDQQELQKSNIPIEQEKKVPDVKLVQGDDFIEDQETLEYLRKVKFLNINKRKAEGKSDKQINEELDDNTYLNDEEKLLKSILKKSGFEKPSEESVELIDSQGRKIKASELARDKRKDKESSLISSGLAMRSGISIPESLEAKQRRLLKEEKEARDAPWKALMDAGDADDEKLREIGGYLEFKELQEYSRENIVIYKRISNHMVRWIISAGKVFDKHGYFFIPIRIIGSPLSKRSTVVYSIIYLELMRFPRSAIMGKDIESIWPFMLYLLNNWIRHQFKVMGIVNEKQLEEKIFERKERIRQEMIDGKTAEEKKEEQGKERLRIRKELKKMTADQRKEYDKLGFEEKEIKRYEEILNFSSEIEYDDLYDIFDDDFKNKKNKEQKSIEGSKELSKLSQKEVYPDSNTRQDPFETPFQQFLAEHTVKLPDTQTNRFKLLKNMQAKSYFEIHAKELEIETIVLLNEERRKYKKLPPLTPLDYNCIDKAAIKIKTVLDTLSILRKMNGKCLVKRNVKEYAAMLERNFKKQETMSLVCKVGMTFGPELMIAFKAAIVYPEKFNRDQVLIKKSLATQDKGIQEEIQEVDSDAEQSDKENKILANNKRTPKPIEKENSSNPKQMLSMHVGSVEEFLPNRALFEQGQIKIDEYYFFVNLYFNRFKLDNIESYKDLDKIMHLEVISK